MLVFILEVCCACQSRQNSEKILSTIYISIINSIHIHSKLFVSNGFFSIFQIKLFSKKWLSFISEVSIKSIYNS